MKRKICTRKIDELGRIVLPLEARTFLKIKERQTLDVYLDEDTILLKPNKDVPACCICGEAEIQLKEVEHSTICNNCIEKIKEI